VTQVGLTTETGTAFSLLIPILREPRASEETGALGVCSGRSGLPAQDNPYTSRLLEINDIWVCLV